MGGILYPPDPAVMVPPPINGWQAAFYGAYHSLYILALMEYLRQLLVYQSQHDNLMTNTLYKKKSQQEPLEASRPFNWEESP